MSKSLRDALTHAFSEKGLEVPQRSKNDPKREREKMGAPTPSSVQPGKGAAKNCQSVEVRRIPKPSLQKPPARSSIRNVTSIRAIQRDIENLSEVYGGGTSPTGPGSKKATAAPSSSAACSLRIGPSPRVNDFLRLRDIQSPLLMTQATGITEQAGQVDESEDVRELAIGLDFGTSSVKVIVGDHAAGRAYAVPFFDTEGIASYLLRSRLYESEGSYSLKAGVKVHRSLKLSLFASGDTSLSYRRATAFLGLVIRHVRAWLFTRHAEIYGNTRIVWKLVLGMPAENYTETQLVDRFRVLARSAWILAGMKHKEITNDIVDLATTRAERFEKEAPATTSAEVAVDVVPELSAQIFGFLQSNRFDKKAKNIYVMVDVGAGTVDSALFHVKSEKGKWHFEFFTNLVQPIGVMNLHRERVDWWLDAFQAHPEQPKKLITALRETEMATDQLGAIPERLEDYVSDVSVSFTDPRKHPDEEFFVKKVVAQVRGKTIWRTWKDGYLDQGTLAGVPLFLCGGGVRMKYFHRLADELKNFPGCTWLNARVMPLEVPRDLDAPGLIRQEYDRLSVAYGLSFLDVGSIVKALPQPRARGPQQPTWHFTDRFVDKDQV